MELAVVTPRYGVAVSGGAEQAARLLSEALVERLGWSVTIMTTTAVDTDWNDGFDAGHELINGVRVERFPVHGRRSADFQARSDRLLPAPLRATAADEQAWLEAQGPVSPALVRAIAHSTAEVIAFHPYLYHPTIAGASVARRPIVLHGAAHDEPPFELRMIRSLYERADGLAFWSASERDLVLDRFAVGSTPQSVIGLGVESGAGDEQAARSEIGLDRSPYVVCVGRVDDGKGCGLLARMFIEHVEREPSELRLVFAGAVVDPPPNHPRVVVAGPVSDATKWGLLRGARALISPSAMESFGIVLAEAWCVGRPVLVNARCRVTSHETRLARGGLTFEDQASFSSALARFERDPALADAFGVAGQRHSRAHFLWDSVLERYVRLINRVGASPATDRNQPSVQHQT